MSEDEKHVELARVRVEKYERIEVVDVAIGDGVTIVSGDNANGKTSLIEAVRQLFSGKGARRVPSIRTGSESAKVVAVLNAGGEVAFTIEQELREGKSDRLVVRDAAGVPTGHGQDWLKSLAGRGLALDPSRFFDPPGARTPEARDKQRLEMLLQVCPIGIDLKAVAEQRAEFYSKRTQVKRDADLAAAELSTLAKKDEPAEVDLASMRRQVAGEREKATSLQRFTETVERIDKQLVEIKKRYAELTNERAATVEKANAVGAAADVTALEAAISEGERTNVSRATIIATNKQYDATMQKLGKSKALAEEATAAIEKLDADKVAALAAAKFPIPGLSVTETQVMLGALPYESASTAERMAAAFAICAAEKPLLGLALIDDAEKFDLPTLETVRKVAAELGVRVLLARRSPDIASDGKVEIVAGRVAP